MALENRELYSSPNGDRWLLAREPESARVFVRHIPNMPSGGKATDIEIGDSFVSVATGLSIRSCCT